jgi:hypothetical protein
MGRKKVSALTNTDSIEGGYSYIILPDPQNPGKFKPFKFKPEDFLQGLIEEEDPVFEAWLLTNPLANKADLVNGIVPSDQLPPSSSSKIEKTGIRELLFEETGVNQSYPGYDARKLTTFTIRPQTRQAVDELEIAVNFPDDDIIIDVFEDLPDSTPTAIAAAADTLLTGQALRITKNEYTIENGNYKFPSISMQPGTAYTFIIYYENGIWDPLSAGTKKDMLVQTSDLENTLKKFYLFYDAQNDVLIHSSEFANISAAYKLYNNNSNRVETTSAGIEMAISGLKVFEIDADGLLKSLTENYENLVLGDNDITNKKYVDGALAMVYPTFADLPPIGSAKILYYVIDTNTFYLYRTTNRGPIYVPASFSIPSGALVNDITLGTGWDATTNTPTIVSGVGTIGDFAEVTTAGTTEIDGITSWAVGDIIWYDSDNLVWKKIDNQVGAPSSETTQSILEKIGDGSKISANYIPDDANHRMVTDAQISKWDGNKTTYVVASQTAMNALTNVLTGEQAIVLDDGDGKRAGYWYNGSSWEKDFDPDWANIVPDWSTITNIPSNIVFDNSVFNALNTTNKTLVAAINEILALAKIFYKEFALSQINTDASASTSVIVADIIFQENVTIDNNSIVIAAGVAPAGSTLIVNFYNNAGTSLFSTPISIDSTEKTNLTAATPYALTTSPMSFNAGDRIYAKITQIGATTPGQNVTGYIKGTKV